MNQRLAPWIAGLCLLGMLVAGCSDSPGKTPFASCNDHDALLAEYKKIADRGATLARSSSSADSSAEAEIHALAEKAVALLHRKLMLTKPPTLQQAQQYDAIAARFQEALHKICPNCPKGK